MYEKFWKKAGDEATLVISGWETMSYFSNKDNVCWFLERGFEEEVRRLHEFVGNAVVDGKHIIVGTGSTQLFQAALFALSDPNSDQPANVVSSVPYYSVSYFLTTSIYYLLLFPFSFSFFLSLFLFFMDGVSQFGGNISIYIHTYKL